MPVMVDPVCKDEEKNNRRADPRSTLINTYAFNENFIKTSQYGYRIDATPIMNREQISVSPRQPQLDK